MEKQNKIYALEGQVQHYQWGGFTYLPQLLSRANEAAKPFAEYWLGAHSQAPALVTGDGKLDHFISTHPEVLGKDVIRKFGRLPYLLKVLDVKDMLSIQVHPTLDNAIVGFAAENANGVPLSAPNRNYKDDNHKPELMAALGEFWLLHGFRATASMINVLQEQPELFFLFNQLGFNFFAFGNITGNNKYPIIRKHFCFDFELYCSPVCRRSSGLIAPHSRLIFSRLP